jgi:GT2 family glycosyltransferase
MIDIVLTSYLRLAYTEKAVRYLRQRTRSPFRLTVVDNGSDELTQKMLIMGQQSGDIDQLILLKNNYGIHAAKNIGLSTVHGFDYYVDTDNDIYVPDIEPDWITKLYTIMCRHPEYAAIACQPQVFIGGVPKISEDEEVFETSHCGAVMRMMKVEAVRSVGGWEKIWDAKRNHEERYICGELRKKGYKVGYAKDITCFHPFMSEGTDKWGYPQEMKPEEHGHNDVHIPETVGDINRYDQKNWREL